MSKTPLNVVFMGTAEIACPSLKVLIGSPAFRVVGVVTQPDKQKGRDLKVQASPVKEIALAAGVSVLQPLSAKSPAFSEELKNLSPDIAVVMAYGQILPAS